LAGKCFWKRHKQKKHLIFRSHPPYWDGFTAGPARSPSCGRDKELLVIPRNVLRPPHPLGGVPRVAPYSSRRHPPALPQEFGHSSISNCLYEEKWSGRADLNGRPPAPKAGALTRLRYAPIFQIRIKNFKLHIITNDQIENGVTSHFHLAG
jgi:hypothetical protein